VLLFLLKYGDVNVTKLSRLTGVNYNSLKRELDYLQDKGYVEVLHLGRAKVVRLNLSNRKVLVLRSFLEEMEDF
jgi:DNA-binding MarR family transcriptional regulator